MNIPLMFWTFVFYIVLQIVALKKLQGRWKKAAIISAIMAIIVIAATLLFAAMGSNLFPVILLLSSPVLFSYISIVVFANYL